MTTDPTRGAVFRFSLARAIAILVVGLLPLPMGWARARSLLNSLRSAEPNRADREANAAGYYQSLIGTESAEGPPDELTLRLLGKPTDWVRFNAANVSRVLDGDPLLFELRPNIDRPLFGQRFTTNAFGLRGRPTTRAKPPGTFRIAVLGSSMDMGWGVGNEASYVNKLETWLNAHAARRGLGRKFEVLNFAVAAYSPMQRLETLRRKALAFEPDLVVYSATMLDPRLIEIHLCDLLQARIPMGDAFLDRALRDAGVTSDDVRLDSQDKFLNKDVLKKKLRTQYWPIYDATARALAETCGSARVPLACVIIPRVGKADVPEARAESVARFHDIFARYGVPVFDLADAFDALDPAQLGIAAWDDHPNAAGHQRLFRVLARALVDNRDIYTTLFPDEGTSRADAPE